MGDDGAGVAVARILRKQNLPPSADLLEGEIDGLTLLERIEGYDRVIIVDAAEMGLKPGEWRAFDAAMDLLKIDFGPSAHQFGVGEALILAKKLNLYLPPIKVYAIQPKRIEFTGKLQLTGPTAKAVRAVAQALLQELFDQP